MALTRDSLFLGGMTFVVELARPLEIPYDFADGILARSTMFDKSKTWMAPRADDALDREIKLNLWLRSDDDAYALSVTPSGIEMTWVRPEPTPQELREDVDDDAIRERLHAMLDMVLRALPDGVPAVEQSREWFTPDPNAGQTLAAMFVRDEFHEHVRGTDGLRLHFETAAEPDDGDARDTLRFLATKVDLQGEEVTGIRVQSKRELRALSDAEPLDLDTITGFFACVNADAAAYMDTTLQWGDAG